jgi:hypothetical protein
VVAQNFDVRFQKAQLPDFGVEKFHLRRTGAPSESAESPGDQIDFLDDTAERDSFTGHTASLSIALIRRVMTCT